MEDPKPTTVTQEAAQCAEKGWRCYKSVFPCRSCKGDTRITPKGACFHCRNSTNTRWYRMNRARINAKPNDEDLHGTN